MTLVGVILVVEKFLQRLARWKVDNLINCFAGFQNV